MTATPQLPTAPAAPTPVPTLDVATVDAQLHGRNLRSGHVIAGVLDAGLLDHVGQPSKLPTALFPDVDEDTVQAIYNLGVAVGVRGGKLLLRPQWDPASLDRFQDALDKAGYQAMGASVATAAQCGRRQHPTAEDLPLWGDEQ
ncbi:hypothetical protein Srufu_079250 (plasmid) [Streptomyces libani subsp. rufus]|nr:hypothetical protein Srufu_079250 [Streptomyces libani subsp. rufus]